MGLIRGIIDDIFTGMGGDDSYITEKEEDKMWQEKMQDKQNDFNLQMWKMNNQFNSPEQQMQRLMNAGISRTGAASLINGGNSAGAITASAMPNAPDQNSSSAGLSAITSLLGGIKSLALMNSEKSNLDADTEVKEAEATRNKSTLYYDIQNLISNNFQIRANINKMYKDMKYTDEQIKYAQILNKYADGMEEAKLKQINEQIKQTQQAVANMKQDEAKMVWENLFRTEFGIDPHDKVMNQLVQAALKGTMDTVFAGFEKSADEVWKYFEKLIKGEDENSPEILGEPVTTLDALHPFYGSMRRVSKWGKAKIKPIASKFPVFIQRHSPFIKNKFGGGKSSGKSGYSGTWN